MIAMPRAERANMVDVTIDGDRVMLMWKASTEAGGRSAAYAQNCIA